MSVLSLEPIFYPDTDGEPMAENTDQADLMVLLKTNLNLLYRQRQDVFVAMDLFWYPVPGHPEIRVAPDIMLAFGRPKGRRGSYRQWDEAGVAPQVVIEIRSPGNRDPEMENKLRFYDRYGVEEYYLYDTTTYRFNGWYRPTPGAPLQPILSAHTWISPRMGIRFDAPGEREMVVYGPDGQPWLPLEDKLTAAEQELSEIERLRVEAEHERVQAERALAESHAKNDEIQAERDHLLNVLRELGIDPNLPRG